MFDVFPPMKMPPFLLFAALLFWGWQSGFFIVGAVLGVILESARFVQARWELDDADFNRIWSFCVLLNVALAGYVFTTNDAGGGFNGMVHGNTAVNVANSGAATATRFLRWLPMTTFAFMVAQIFNARQSVPLTAVSLVLRWRRRRGDRALAGHYVNISFPYFIVCLFSAGIHTNNGSQLFFWGECALVTWALWSLRSHRFGIYVWLGALMMVIGLGFLGEFGINQAQRGIQNFNAQWMAKFFSQRTDPLQSMTSMGRIGKLKLSSKIMMWLEPRSIGHAPEYLREASYRNYSPRNQTWYAGGTLNDFESVLAERDNTSWVLVAGKTNNASVNITCYLKGHSKDGDPEGVLPVPSGCSRLEHLPSEISVIALQKNRMGTVLAIGSGLMTFDANYGSGLTMDAPPDFDSTNHFDLSVPANEQPALNQVISEMHLTAANDAERRVLIENFFLSKFTYSVWQGEEKIGTAAVSPLTRFLTTSRSGHCEYFATATVLLLRQLGIPARYAVGYAVHETSGSGYIVRARDAHAWCLVWNRATKVWEDFDTTPPTWVAIESQRSADTEWFSDFKSWLGLQFAKFRWRQAHLQQYIFWGLVPVLLVLLYHIIFRHRKQKGRAKKPTPEEVFSWPGLDSEFYLLEQKLALRGVLRQPSESLADWLRRALAVPELADLRNPLQELLKLHYRLRFDPRGLSDVERAALTREAKVCLAKLAQVESARRAEMKN